MSILRNGPFAMSNLRVKVDSHENWTIGGSSDENFGIFKVPNMFLHIMCLYCIGLRVHFT